MTRQEAVSTSYELSSLVNDFLGLAESETAHSRWMTYGIGFASRSLVDAGASLNRSV